MVLLFFALFAIGSMAHAGQFGPPEPTAKQGKVAVGAGYFHSSAKWKPGKVNDEWKTKSIDQNQIYAQVSYGLVKDAEVYLRLGGADMKADIFNTTVDNSALSGFKSDLKDDMKPFSTIGAKGIVYRNKNFAVGLFVNITFYSDYNDKTAGTESGAAVMQEMNIKSQREINIGIGAQGKIGDITLYGGPVAYWTKASVHRQWREPSGRINSPEDNTYKEKGNVGGFAGLKIPLGKNFSVEVEGQYKSDFSAGAALTYSF